MAACANQSRPEKGGFYSYVDASGQIVTIARDAAPTSTRSTSGLGTDEDGAADPSVNAPQPDVARTPTELWNTPEDDYLSDADVQQMLDRRERERFVTYQDESGRLVTRSVDMKAARQAAQAQDEQRLFVPLDAPQTRDGWTEVRADCCGGGTSAAPVLGAGQQLAAFADVRAVHAVTLGQPHPAVTFRLGENIEAVEVQTWLKKEGYLHPQMVLLDERDEPLLLVASPFSRRYPETWAAHASLWGRVEVPPAARSVVLVLGYAAHHEAHGMTKSLDETPGQEAGWPLALKGELVIRGVAGNERSE